jgi:recombination protein RecA
VERSALAIHLLTKVQLQQQLERECMPTGITGFDAVTGGILRGAINEIHGPASSGKTTFLHALVANACANGEFCSLVDASDSFDPASASSAGTDLSRLLWVRCSGAEQAIRSADLLVHSGGWGVIILDLTDARPETLRKIPLSYWYRFKRAVENTPAAFIVLTREPQAKNCAAMSLELPPARPVWSGAHHDFRLLRGLDIRVTPRKPVRSETAEFRAKALA